MPSGIGGVVGSGAPTFDGETVYCERRDNRDNQPTIYVDGRCSVTYYQGAP